MISVETRSTGTVYTPTKARLTSAAIWRISMSSRFMSVNHFPYLPIVANPENNPCIKTVIRIATNIQTLAHCQSSLKISCKSVRKFLRKLLTGKQNDEQLANNMKHWDSACLRHGTSYQCRDTDPDPDTERDPSSG